MSSGDTWVAIPTVVDHKPIPDRWAKGVFDNTQSLANPVRLLERGQVSSPAAYQNIALATFTDVNAAWSKDFYSTGRDILVMMNIWALTSAGDTTGQLDLTIDGVSPFGTNGFATISWQDQPNGYSFCYPIFGVAAGLHTVKLRHRRTTGTGNMRTAVFPGDQWMFITEF